MFAVALVAAGWSARNSGLVTLVAPSDSVVEGSDRAMDCVLLSNSGAGVTTPSSTVRTEKVSIDTISI